MPPALLHCGARSQEFGLRSPLEYFVEMLLFVRNSRWKARPNTYWDGTVVANYRETYQEEGRRGHARSRAFAGYLYDRCSAAFREKPYR
jgi:hypothetical protein